MSTVALHMRMTSLQVSNDDVNTRTAAITDLVQEWCKLTDTSAIIERAAEIAQALGGNGVPSQSLAAEVERVVQCHASAFLCIDKPLEVGICAGLAAVELMKTPGGSEAWSMHDVLAAALWSALTFQPPLGETKREALRTEVLDAARSRIATTGETARKRSNVIDFGELEIVAGAEATVPENFKKATTATIEALRRNAALDREELDFLWWTQLGRSKLLARMFNAIEEPVRLVAAGIEAAGYLRRLPSEVHRDVVLRTLDANPELDLPDLIEMMGADRVTLGGRYAEGLIARAPTAFPLLHALATGLTLADGSMMKRSSADWGARALLEAGLAQIQSTGPAKL